MSIRPQTPRGMTKSPHYFIIADSNIPEGAYAPWFAYDLIRALHTSPLGAALLSEYGIEAAVYDGFVSTPFPAADYPADAAVDALLGALSTSPSPDALFVFITSAENAGIPPGSNVLAYHDFTDLAPYAWVPYRALADGPDASRDMFTWTLAHEWMEMTTDTYPGMGVVYNGSEIGDTCEGVHFTIDGELGYAYDVQGFETTARACYAPSGLRQLDTVQNTALGKLHLDYYDRARGHALALARRLPDGPPQPPQPPYAG